MKLRIMILRLVIIATGTCALTNGVAQTKTPPAAFDASKVLKEVEQRNTLFLEALRNSDSADLGNFYTADAKIFNSGRPTTSGQKAITAFYGRSIRRGINKATIVTKGVWGSDHNLVVEEGTIEFLFADGKTAVKGRYLVVWKRDDGVLKIFRDSFTEDEKYDGEE